MSSLFTRIIQGEIPCHKLYEDDDFIAFLDINPIRPGHALLVPKVEEDYIFDQSDDVLSKMLIVAKRVGIAIESVVSCERMGITVLGLEIPHTHLHLVPIDDGELINFSMAREGNMAELAKLSEKIRAQLS
jgi:histidine triad (HIT) family protein